MADNGELKKIIAEIRATIDSWKPLLAKPSEFIDLKTFTSIPNPGIHLVKIGNEIKVCTDNIGDLSITEKDLIPPEGRKALVGSFLLCFRNQSSCYKIHIRILRF